MGRINLYNKMNLGDFDDIIKVASIRFEGKGQEIKCEPDGKIYRPASKQWDIREDDLRMKIEMELINTDKLFEGLMPIAPRDATISVALEWRCKQTKKQGVEEICEIKWFEEKDEKKMVSFSKEFKHQDYSGEISCKIIVFMKEVESVFPVDKGFRTGTIQHFIIEFEGSGSEFPTLKEEDKDGNRLAYIAYETIDLDQTLEDNGIKLITNPSHHLFSEFDKKEDFFYDKCLDAFYQFVLEIKLELKHKGGSLEEELKDCTKEPGTLGYMLNFWDGDWTIKSDDYREIYKNMSNYYNSKRGEKDANK